MRKTLFHFYFIILFATQIFAQQIMNKDSLLQLLPTIKNNVAGVELYINIGQQYESNEPEKAKYYYKQAGRLSEKINYPLGVIQYLNNYTGVLTMQDQYDLALKMNLKAVAIARKINDSVSIGKTLFNTGTSYRNLAQYEEASKYYEEGKKIFAKVGNPDIEARSNDILQILYYELGQYDKAIDYGENAVTYLRKIDDKYWLCFSLSNLGMSYEKKKNHKKALLLFKESLAIGKKINNLEAVAAQMQNIASIYFSLGEYDKLQPYYSKALELYTNLGSSEGMSISFRGLSLYYLSKNQLDTAEEFSKKSLKVLNKKNSPFQHRKILETLSNISYAKHDMKTAEKYLALSEIIGDSIANEKIKRNILELEKKYQTEKKDALLKLQKAEIKHKQFLNYLFGGFAIVLLLSSYLLYKNFTAKRRINEQKIIQLETEKQLTASEAVLKGEDQERTRIAKDLHDGLGGMLSGIKYSFNTMKGNLIMTPDNAQAFNKSMDMLDQSIKEMRRVAHNMMPEALIRFGIDAALRDYCTEINNSGAVKAIYQSMGMEKVVFEQNIAIAIYRIVQELLNNSLKHAEATELIVQLFYENSKLIVNVEDNGKGFDTAILNYSKGIGWGNIQSRVDYLKGKLDIQTEANKGTSVHIEINI